MPSSFEYPYVSEIRHALKSIKPNLPIIKSAEDVLGNNRSRSLDSPDETVNSFMPKVRALSPAIDKCARWFVRLCHAYAGEDNFELTGYAGIVGEAGQILTYLHGDPVSLRFALTFADIDCPVNPSTITLSSREKITLGHDLYQKTVGELFPPIETQQAPQGKITIIEHMRGHQESPLPVGTAKFALFATFDEGIYN